MKHFEVFERVWTRVWRTSKTNLLLAQNASSKQNGSQNLHKPPNQKTDLQFCVRAADREWHKKTKCNCFCNKKFWPSRCMQILQELMKVSTRTQFCSFTALLWSFAMVPVTWSIGILIRVQSTSWTETFCKGLAWTCGTSKSWKDSRTFNSVRNS